jgi:predicted NBD/HSP70 family sugar kinase
MPPRRPLPPPPTGSTPAPGRQRWLRHLNQVALLRLLRERPGLSRAQLADHSGLTRSTVSLLTQDLIDAGWVAEDAAEATGALGRRPTPLRLDGRRFALVGLELAPDALRGAIVSVQGEVQHAEQHAPRGRDAATVVAQLAALSLDLVRRARREQRRQVLGVGVGLPGAVTAAEGLLRVAPNFGWRDLPVAAPLRQALADAGIDDVPVLVQNEADLAAIGELEFGPRPTGSPLVYVSCGIGLGSGIVVDDRLFTGATGAAGEIGHSTLHEGGRACACGRRGCAEAYVGLRALAACAGTLQPDGDADRTTLQVRLRQHDTAAVAACQEAGHDLGVLLHNLAALMDPQLIVLGGETVALAGEHLVRPAREVLERSARQAGWAAPALRIARFGEQAVVVGGAALVLRQLLKTSPQAPDPAAVWFSSPGADPR